MKILFARKGQAYPESAAGVELTMHGLASNLARDGHLVAVASMTRTGRRSITDDYGFLSVQSSSPHQSFAKAMELIAPDVIVVMQSGDWLSRIEPLMGHKPLVIYEHDCQLTMTRTPASLIARSAYIANSKATAAHILKVIGKPSTVIPPIFGIERYSSIRSVGDEILFVSLSARKGAEIALDIARNRREHRFLFIQSWNTEEQIVDAARQLGNVEVLPNQKDLLHIFPRVRLLLMPSKNHEAWGRTASEAQVCGIPVLASNRGNLPDTIGEGGIALDPELDISHWLSAFDELLSASYSQYAAKAADRGAQLVRDIPLFYDRFVKQLSHHMLVTKQLRIKSSFL